MNKEFLLALREMGLTEYGSVITAGLVYELLGITVPEVATQSEFRDIDLQVLSAIDHVRAALLNEGKYLCGHGGGYRILLPSENRKQIESYMSQADKKLRRAGKLSKNTPTFYRANDSDQVDARIMLKRTSARQYAGAVIPTKPKKTAKIPARV